MGFPDPEGGSGGGDQSRDSLCSAPQCSYAWDEGLSVKHLKILLPVPGLLTPIVLISPEFWFLESLTTEDGLCEDEVVTYFSFDFV